MWKGNRVETIEYWDFTTSYNTNLVKYMSKAMKRWKPPFWRTLWYGCGGTSRHFYESYILHVIKQSSCQKLWYGCGLRGKYPPFYLVEPLIDWELPHWLIKIRILNKVIASKRYRLRYEWGRNRHFVENYVMAMIGAAILTEYMIRMLWYEPPFPGKLFFTEVNLWPW